MVSARLATYSVTTCRCTGPRALAPHWPRQSWSTTLPTRCLYSPPLPPNLGPQSTSVYVALKLETTSPALEVEQGQEVHCLVWTTTPWSLVANRAVCYHPSMSYSLVRSPARYSPPVKIPGAC